MIFDSIEEIFQNLRNFDEYSKALVTLATATGTLFILYYFIDFIFELFEGLRLYVCSQFCCTTNLLNKYGTWAVISGSTDGIGLAMARELARRGHSIIVIGRNETKLSATKSLLEQEANVGEVITIKIDLSDSSIDNFEKIRDQIDPDNRDIGILINNAGIFPDELKRFYRFEMSYLQSIVNVNILATVYLTRMILPGMVDRGRGLLVAVSSMLGAVPAPYVSVYGPTKSFIDAFSQQLQIEYSKHPIDIINLTPGGVYTKLYTNLRGPTVRQTVASPSPEEYARTAINAFSTRVPSYCGTLIHGILFKMSKIFIALGLYTLIYSHFSGASRSLSPIMKRKRPQAQEHNNEPSAQQS